MNLVVDVVSWICLVVGAAFCVVGGVGLLRMPDFYSRTHAASITDSLGAGLILLGLMFQGGVNLVTAKLALIWAFLWLSSPPSTHALAKAAYSRGLRVQAQPGGARADSS